MHLSAASSSCSPTWCATRPGVSREQILTAVWGYDHDPGTNIVEVYVGYLRRKLGARPPGADRDRALRRLPAGGRHDAPGAAFARAHPADRRGRRRLHRDRVRRRVRRDRTRALGALATGRPLRHGRARPGGVARVAEPAASPRGPRLPRPRAVPADQPRPLRVARRAGRTVTNQPELLGPRDRRQPGDAAQQARENRPVARSSPRRPAFGPSHRPTSARVLLLVRDCARAGAVVARAGVVSRPRRSDPRQAGRARRVPPRRRAGALAALVGRLRGRLARRRAAAADGAGRRAGRRRRPPPAHGDPATAATRSGCSRRRSTTCSTASRTRSPARRRSSPTRRTSCAHR